MTSPPALIAASATGTLTVWASVSEQGCAVEQRSATLLCLAASTDDSVVFAEVVIEPGAERSAATPSRLCLWRYGAGVTCSLEVGREVRSVAALAEGRIIYTDSADMVHLWDPQTGAGGSF